MSATKSDVTLLNAGTLRSDRIHPAGDFKMKDMIEILPLGGSVCVLEMTGKNHCEHDHEMAGENKRLRARDNR